MRSYLFDDNLIHGTTDEQIEQPLDHANRSVGRAAAPRPTAPSGAVRARQGRIRTLILLALFGVEEALAFAAAHARAGFGFERRSHAAQRALHHRFQLLALHTAQATRKSAHTKKNACRILPSSPLALVYYLLFSLPCFLLC
jgi:hypothetical protein